MTLLVLGILLWWGAHLFKRLSPGMRASLGDGGKGDVAVATQEGIVVLVWHGRYAEVLELGL